MIHERTRPCVGETWPIAVSRPQPSPEDPAVRFDLLRTETFPGRPLQTLMVRLEIPPGSALESHRHPGLEMGYVASGFGALRTPRMPPETLAPGTTFCVPRLAAHSLRSDGPGSLVIISAYVVEADLPLTLPAA